MKTTDYTDYTDYTIARIINYELNFLKFLRLANTKFSRKFSAKLPQLETKSPTVEENFLEKFSRQSSLPTTIVIERLL